MTCNIPYHRFPNGKSVSQAKKDANHLKKKLKISQKEARNTIAHENGSVLCWNDTLKMLKRHPIPVDMFSAQFNLPNGVQDKLHIGGKITLQELVGVENIDSVIGHFREQDEEHRNYLDSKDQEVIKAEQRQYKKGKLPGGVIDRIDFVNSRINKESL